MILFSHQNFKVRAKRFCLSGLMLEKAPWVNSELLRCRLYCRDGSWLAVRPAVCFFFFDRILLLIRTPFQLRHIQHDHGVMNGTARGYVTLFSTWHYAESAMPTLPRAGARVIWTGKLVLLDSGIRRGRPLFGAESCRRRIQNPSQGKRKNMRWPASHRPRKQPHQYIFICRQPGAF